MLSLMHYSSKAFSTTGSNTIDMKDAAYALYTTDPAKFANYKPGNRVGLTQLDAATAIAALAARDVRRAVGDLARGLKALVVAAALAIGVRPRAAVSRLDVGASAHACQSRSNVT